MTDGRNNKALKLETVLLWWLIS